MTQHSITVPGDFECRDCTMTTEQCAAYGNCFCSCVHSHHEHPSSHPHYYEGPEGQPYRDTAGMDRVYGGQEPPFDVNDDFARSGSIFDY